MWQLIFWCGVAAIAYVYAGYPLLLFVAGRVRRRRPPSTPEAPLPSVCLIISAYNEEAVIRARIENCLSSRYPDDRLTVLVASDGSSDGTVAAAGAYADRGVVVRHFAKRQGKSAVLNDVVRERDEDLIVFTDANASFEPDTVTFLARRFADPAVGCVVGRLRYVEDERTSVGEGESTYWGYEGTISRLESAVGSVLVANGANFAVRRELFEPLYPEVANDFQIPMDVAGHGAAVVYEPRARAAERTTVYWHEEFGRKVRIVLRGLTGYSRLRRRIRGFRLWQFWSHKVLRWMVGAFLLPILATSVVLAKGSLFYSVALAGQILFYLAAVNGWLTRRSGRSRRLFYIPFYFTMVNAAALVAFVKFAAGRRQSVWNKAESTRTESVTVEPPPEHADSDGEVGAATVGRN